MREIAVGHLLDAGKGLGPTHVISWAQSIASGAPRRVVLLVGAGEPLTGGLLPLSSGPQSSPGWFVSVLVVPILLLGEEFTPPLRSLVTTSCRGRA